MASHVTLPKWFSKPFPKIDQPRRDFFLCTNCGTQSCGGVYLSTCIRCHGVSTNPPQDKRFDYLCVDCSRKRRACTCDSAEPIIIYEPIVLPRPPTQTKATSPVNLSRSCCCSCSWCNYFCKCACCCLFFICQSSSFQQCCISKYDCHCCSCYWSWLSCSCKRQSL